MVRGFNPTSDSFFKLLTAILASVIIVVIGLTAYTLVRSSYPVLTKFGFKFVTGIYWNPIPPNEVFGALPYLLGTIVTSAIAIFVGVPISIAIAIFLAEMAPERIVPYNFFLGLWRAFLRLWRVFSNLVRKKRLAASRLDIPRLMPRWCLPRPPSQWSTL